MILRQFSWECRRVCCSCNRAKKFWLWLCLKLKWLMLLKWKKNSCLCSYMMLSRRRKKTYSSWFTREKASVAVLCWILRVLFYFKPLLISHSGPFLVRKTFNLFDSEPPSSNKVYFTKIESTLRSCSRGRNLSHCFTLLMWCCCCWKSGRKSRLWLCFVTESFLYCSYSLIN